MSRNFLWWAWDDTQTPPRRGAVFADYDKNVVYVCHYQDELPCSKCKGEPFKIKSAKDYRAEERKRIEANIRSRIADLEACTKRDNCLELADLLEDYLPEWLGEN